MGPSVSEVGASSSFVSVAEHEKVRLLLNKIVHQEVKAVLDDVVSKVHRRITGAITRPVTNDIPLMRVTRPVMCYRRITGPVMRVTRPVTRPVMRVTRPVTNGACNFTLTEYHWLQAW